MFIPLWSIQTINRNLYKSADPTMEQQALHIEIKFNKLATYFYYAMVMFTYYRLKWEIKSAHSVYMGLTQNQI